MPNGDNRKENGYDCHGLYREYTGVLCNHFKSQLKATVVLFPT